MERYRRHLSPFVLLLQTLYPAAVGHAGTISDRLKSRLSGLDHRQSIPIIITLTQRADPFPCRQAAFSVGGMLRSLEDSVGRQYNGVRARIMDGWPREPAKIFWINQTIGLSATWGFIEQPALDPDIELIEEDEALFSRKPLQRSQAVSASPSVVPWNLTITGVDAVWSTYGLDGSGVLIGSLDTGMQWILDPDGDPATDDYPRVVNNSWFSGTRGSTYAFSAASAWRAAGIIPMFCAGNSGPTSGTTRSPDINYFPADGRKPDISAPSEAVYSCKQGGGYSTSSGTSWSSPHVAGIIALMLQANPTLEHGRVLSILKHSAVDRGTEGYDYVFGYGRINALAAGREALKSRVYVQADLTLPISGSGGSSYFEIVLTVIPNDTGCISLSSTDTTEGTLGPNVICFLPSNWNIPQRAYVMGTVAAAR